MVQNRCKEYRMEKRIIMLHKVYDIELPYEELGLKTPDKKATITTYIKEMYPDYQDPFNRPLVIICPGGGYDHHSPREGESMAIKMLDLGYNAVVLRYSLAPYVYPTQLVAAKSLINNPPIKHLQYNNMWQGLFVLLIFL